MMRKIPLASPEIGEEEKRAVMSVLDSSILSIGPKINAFEERMADYANRDYAVAVNSGTSALDLILRSVGIAKGDQYITTSFSFISSSNILLFQDAVPVFADIDPKTFNIDPDSIRSILDKKKDVKGIIAVDVFGQPCDWDSINKIAGENELKLIEDSCEALGSEYKGERCGSFGLSGAFAFYPNKQITTGEGGIIVTDSEEIYKKSKSMRNQGRGVDENWLEHVRLGFNYRLNELSAVLGIEQLKKIETFISKRERVAQRYNELFSSIDGVSTPHIDETTTKMSWFVYVITLDETINRDAVLKYLRDSGIGCRNYFSPIHLQPFYKKRFGFKEGLLPVTEDISKRTVALPFFNNLSGDDQAYIAENLKAAIERSAFSEEMKSRSKD